MLETSAGMTGVEGWDPACDARAPPDAEGERIGPAAGRSHAPGPRIRVERVPGHAMDVHRAAWADLAGRSLEHNVFLQPAFALPLLAHAFVQRPDVLLAWDTADRLVGLLPVRLGARWRIGGSLARGFAHQQIAVGTPLLDERHGPSAFAAMLGWLRARSDAAGLCLTDIPADGAFDGLVAAMDGVTSHRLDERRRAAILSWSTPGASMMPVTASSRRRKELRRQRRRLSELGERSYTSARSPEAVAAAMERFLALENDGWKGGRGTALLADPALAAFARTMTRSMARDGRCRIDAIESDGRALAMGIVLMVGGKAYFWKTTYDERHASLSPGVQFACDLTQALREEAALTGIDSCAVPDHPMIDRLWPDRIAIHDLLIDLRPDEPARTRRALRAERRRRRLRRGARALALALRRWRAGTR